MCRVVHLGVGYLMLGGAVGNGLMTSCISMLLSVMLFAKKEYAMGN